MRVQPESTIMYRNCEQIIQLFYYKSISPSELSQNLLQTLRKHQEAAIFLLTRAHCYTTHSLIDITE